MSFLSQNDDIAISGYFPTNAATANTLLRPKTVMNDEQNHSQPGSLLWLSGQRRLRSKRLRRSR
jgi:hypothetical protein